MALQCARFPLALPACDSAGLPTLNFRFVENLRG
jgi:hypothetical protein